MGCVQFVGNTVRGTADLKAACRDLHARLKMQPDLSSSTPTT